jgi:LPXTG-site transpeptidase (sortase) family protein
MSFAVVGAVVLGVGGWLQLRDDDPVVPSGAAPAASSTPSDSSPSTSPSGSPSSSPSSRPKPNPRVVRDAPGTPRRIQIPALSVSARVVGIRLDGGTLVPPSNPRVIGWWADGARPGAARGSALLTGHAVRRGTGAFDQLGDLERGSTVVVGTDRSRLTYRVTSVTTYRKRALARSATRLFDQSVPGRLVLVTCEDWNGSVYLSNVVVMAERTS